MVRRWPRVVVKSCACTTHELSTTRRLESIAPLLDSRGTFDAPPMSMSIITALGHALSDPTRLLMLSTALEYEAISVGELAQATGYATSTVSAHVAALRDSGLVETRRRGRRTIIQARHDRWRVVRDACLACGSGTLVVAPVSRRRPSKGQNADVGRRADDRSWPITRAPLVEPL